MNWNYKSVIIEIEEDGKFYFSINGKTEKADSLEIAKSWINLSLKDYYTFSEKDIDKLYKKLDKRESEFVRSLTDELDRHRCNAYCEMGITDEMLFEF